MFEISTIILFTATKSLHADNGPLSHVARSCISSLTDDFFETKSPLEQKKLEEKIYAELDSLSVNFSRSCEICPAEWKLRNFLLGDDNLNVVKGIGIYASIFVVMLLKGLAPKLSNERGLDRLVVRLKTTLEVPNFFPMSNVRRDIETVIKMLSAFEKLLKEEKMQKAIGLVEEINRDTQAENVSRYLKRYLCYIAHHVFMCNFFILSLVYILLRYL